MSAKPPGLLERFWVRFAVRVLWRWNPAKKLEAIRRFSATEADGVFHMLRGLEAVEDPKERAEIFSQIMEEVHHAYQFASLHKRLSGRPFSPPPFEREALYDSGSEAWKFFAYLHVVEEDATVRFRGLVKELGDDPLEKTLRKVLADESRHVGSAQSLVAAQSVDAHSVDRELRNIRRRRLWEAWLRAGRSGIDRLISLLLGALYFLGGPFAYGTARRKMGLR